MTASHRVARVERELFQLVSEHLQYEMAEPLPGFVSITAAEVSPDLKHAKIYFRLVGEKADQDEAKDILDDHRKSFQSHVARNLKTKYCPVLKFVYGLVESADEVDVMLMNLKKGKE
jgi:ribosome-binding factor A